MLSGVYDAIFMSTWGRISPTHFENNKRKARTSYRSPGFP